MRRAGVITFIGASLALTWAASAGSIVAGGDPAAERIIWADPFDWYTQYYYDTYVAANPALIFSGGPTPAGAVGGTLPDKGPCAVDRQNTPAIHQMMRSNWVSNGCTAFVAPAGFPTAGVSTIGSNFANGAPCGSGGRVETQSMEAQIDSRWNAQEGFTSMGQFTYDLLPRIQAIAQTRALGDKNAINGTDADPLTIVFWLGDGGGCEWALNKNTNQYEWYCNMNSIFNNSYVELAYGDERAPTDYVWRGDRNKTYPDPDGCPNGPFPVICQQAREGDGAAWVNANCPALKPPYDPTTGTGKTWKALAFGLLAILDKDPCEIMNQGGSAHAPEVDHYVTFDGNKWRELRNSYYQGLNNAQTNTPIEEGYWNENTWVPGTNYWATSFWPPERNMIIGNAPSNNFVVGYGYTLVYIKIMTNHMLIYAESHLNDRPSLQTPNPSTVHHSWHAAVPRAYKGGFNKIRWGVGAGCAVDPTTGECVGTTTRRCLSYGGLTTTGYHRPSMDGMAIYSVNQTPDANIIKVDDRGACCNASQMTCEQKLQSECLSPNRFDGQGTTCGQYKCCPNQYGDMDADGDVDMEDFAVLQQCFTTPGKTNVNSLQCACLDTEGDGDVDVTDYTRFTVCASGANIPADVNCPTQWPQ